LFLTYLSLTYLYLFNRFYVCSYIYFSLYHETTANHSPCNRIIVGIKRVIRLFEIQSWRFEKRNEFRHIDVWWRWPDFCRWDVGRNRAIRWGIARGPNEPAMVDRWQCQNQRTVGNRHAKWNEQQNVSDE